MVNVQGGLRRLIDEVQSARSATLANGFVGDTDNGDVTAPRAFFLSRCTAR